MHTWSNNDTLLSILASFHHVHIVFGTQNKLVWLHVMQEGCDIYFYNSNGLQSSQIFKWVQQDHFPRKQSPHPRQSESHGFEPH